MLIVLALTMLEPPAQAEPLDWLVRTWCTDPSDGPMTCETWSPMKKGVMHGESTTGSGGRVTTRETMRIYVNESGIFFHAQPEGQRPTAFRAVKIDAKSQTVTFENASHNYPQRIRYRREGMLLHAEISLADGSKLRRWSYLCMDCDVVIMN